MHVSLAEAKLKLLSLNVLYNVAYSPQRAIIVLPVAYLKKIPDLVWLSGLCCVHPLKVLLCATADIFTHLRKNILVTVKNWWSLAYGHVYIYTYDRSHNMQTYFICT